MADRQAGDRLRAGLADPPAVASAAAHPRRADPSEDHRGPSPARQIRIPMASGIMLRQRRLRVRERLRNRIRVSARWSCAIPSHRHRNRWTPAIHAARRPMSDRMISPLPTAGLCRNGSVPAVRRTSTSYRPVAVRARARLAERWPNAKARGTHKRTCRRTNGGRRAGARSPSPTFDLEAERTKAAHQSGEPLSLRGKNSRQGRASSMTLAIDGRASSRAR